LAFILLFYTTGFSTCDLENSVALSTLPLGVKCYANSDENKLKILKENDGKSGIYQWINKSNGKSYVGSSINISTRLKQYFNLNYLLKNSNKMIICNALLKYGYSKFELIILEYCENKSSIIEREQYYLNKINPEYNTLKKAGSSLGYRHSSESLSKMSAAKLGSKLSEETKDKIAAYRLGKPRTWKAGSLPQRIEVCNNLTGSIKEYESIRGAAADLGLNRESICNYFRQNQTKPYKGIYSFKKI
jgi:group I intron endonuclease